MKTINHFLTEGVNSGINDSKGNDLNDMRDNTFGVGFDDVSATEHLSKRQKDGHYTNLTKEEYKAQALSLLQTDVGGHIAGYETKEGKVVRWDKETNDYVTGFRGKKIKTMFPLRGGQQRFDRLRENDERE